MASTDIGPVTLARGRREPDQPGRRARPDVNSEKSYLGKIGIGERHVQLRDDRAVRSGGRRRRSTSSRTGRPHRPGRLARRASTATRSRFGRTRTTRGSKDRRRRRGAPRWRARCRSPRCSRRRCGSSTCATRRTTTGIFARDELLPDRAAGQPQRDLRRDRYARVRARREPHAQDRGPLGPRKGEGLRRARTSSSRTPRAAPTTRSWDSRRSSTRSSPSYSDLKQEGAAPARVSRPSLRRGDA